MACNRERYLDIVKGWGIWCIVLMHYECGVFPDKLNIFVGSYMITLFYVVSGTLMARRDEPMSTKILFLRRLRQLGIPYLWWSILILLFDSLLWGIGYYDGYMIAREAYKTVVLRGIGTLWFLPALFFGELIWNYLKDRRAIVIVIMMAVTVSYGYFYSYVFDGQNEMIYRIIDAPFRTLNNVCGAVIGIAFGWVFYKMAARKIEDSKKYILMLFGFLLCILAFFTANYLHIIVGEANRYLWRFFAPLIGPVGFIVLAKSLDSFRVMSFLEYWGRNSLLLMVMHYSLVLVLCQIIDQYILGHTSFIGIMTLVYFVASVPVLYFLSQLINKRGLFLLCK